LGVRGQGGIHSKWFWWFYPVWGYFVSHLQFTHTFFELKTDFCLLSFPNGIGIGIGIGMGMGMGGIPSQSTFYRFIFAIFF
jgi:hypothetical protein